MTEEMDRTSQERPATPGWLFAALAVLGVVAMVGLVMARNASIEAKEVQIAFDEKVKTMQENFSSQLTQLQLHQTEADTSNTGVQGDVTALTHRLRLTESELKKARAEAARIAAESAQKLAEVNGDVKNELATKASADEVRSVDGKLSVVRTDLDAATQDLKLARSELGTLIARNHEEIEHLRRLGEREYVEFTINSKNKPQNVGNVMVELRGTNPNKKRYNMVLIVDDVRIEKKNLPVNEPIFFHRANARQSLEMVVNSVGKDTITGYISSPKASATQTAASN